MSNPIAELVAIINLKGGKESVAAMKGLCDVTIATKNALLQQLTVLYKWSEAARQAAMSLEIYQTNTGLSGEQLQEMSYKAAQAGVSVNELSGQIQKIQQMSKDIELGQGDAKPFQLMEIDPRQNPIDILDELSEKLRSLHQYDPARAKQMANMFGISDTMFYSMLDDSNEKMNKQFLLTQKEQKALVQLNKEWNKVWFYIKQIGIKLQGMGAVLQSQFVKILLNAVQGLGEILTRIADVINANEDLKNALLIIGGVLAALFAPWLLQLAAIALILEDIFVYFQGGDSVTGQIVEWCQQSETFMKLWEAIKFIWEVVVGLFKAAYEGWQNLLACLSDAGVFDWILEKIKSIVDLINMAVDGWLMLSQSKLGQWVLKRLGMDEQVNDFAAKRLTEDGYGEMVATPPLSNNSSNFTQNNNVVLQSTGDIHQDQQAASSFVREVSDAQDAIPAVVGGV